MEKERIIYDSYADRFAETREWLLESESFAPEEITDEIVYDAIADDLRFEMEEVRENLRNLFAGETLIAVGHCGTWRGNLPAGNVSDDFDDMFDRMTCDCDYIKIWDENGHLFVECSHHDGTDRFEIKRLTARGVALYEQWESDWDDKRTRQQIHALLFGYNLFSALPHYFGAEKQDASKATPRRITAKLSNQAWHSARKRMISPAGGIVPGRKDYTMASTTVYEIRTDSITLKVPNRNHMIVKRFLDENVDDSAAFMGENSEAIEEYATEAEALEALKAYHATAGAGWGVRCYEVDVISYWVIPVEYELDEDGERDYCYYEDHDPIAFAPFRDDISLYFDRYPIFDWNGKEWVRRIEDWEVDDEEDAEE